MKTKNVMCYSALLYATKFNLPVFPSSQQKIPLIADWFHRSSKDPEIIEGWWEKYPSANISMATGSASGIIVLDVDVKNEEPGFDSLRELEMKYGDLPKTPNSLSPSGGQHFLFRYDGPPLRRKIRFMPGLDLMAEDSQILLPPSVGANGKKYMWEITGRIDEVAVAPIPGWLVELVSASSSTNESGSACEATAFWKNLARGAVEGSRNKSVAQLAGYLLRRYVDPHLTLELIQLWNASNNSPPLSEAEVTKTVDSIGGKESRRRKGVHRG